MNAVINGIAAKLYRTQANREKTISFDVSFLRFEKAITILEAVKKLYRKTILYDFKNIFNARVE